MLRGLFTCCVFVLATAIFGSLVMVAGLLLPGRDVTMRIARLWSRTCLLAAGVRPVHENREHAAARLPCIFIANHHSILDIWALIPVLPTSTRFVAKRSLFWIPIFGWAIAAAGFVPIDRKNRTAALRSLARAAEKVRKGRSLLLFAEGTRSRDGRLRPFKRGAFHLALEAGVPIVPVAISGSGRVLPPGFLFRIAPGEVRLAFSAPIDVAPYAREAGIDALVRDARARIVERLAPEELGPGDAVRAGAP